MNQGDPPKTSFCRFYLRGLCVLSAKECSFAHGVWDLNYQYYQQGEEVVYVYDKAKDNKQKNFIKGPRIFKNLYEFQTEKKYSLGKINTDKDARSEVRAAMHRQLYDEFMQLLEIKHPATPFTEDFLLREFSRVGFNKVLLVPLKYNNIANSLCDNFPVSRFFRSTKVVPPNPAKQNVLLRRAQKEDIIAAYRAAYFSITADKAEIDEGSFRKALYTAQLPEDVPSVNTLLKETKLGLREFLEDFLGLQQTKLQLESTVEDVVAAAEQFLAEQLPQRMVEWGDVFQHLAKALKMNNGNLLNQARPFLATHHAFLFFPKHELIFSREAAPFFAGLQPAPCPCGMQQPFPREELCLPSLEEAEPLAAGESYDIFNYETLARCAPHILASGVLGVDLEGRLRRGGFVEMVQLNNGRNTFLLDVWFMNELGEFEAFWLAKKVLRNVMTDPAIVKVLHDCRHDSIGLHEFLETCAVNVFDTSAAETLITQLEAYEALWKSGKGAQGQQGKKERSRKVEKEAKEGNTIKEGKKGKEEKEEKQHNELLYKEKEEKGHKVEKEGKEGREEKEELYHKESQLKKEERQSKAERQPKEEEGYHYDARLVAAAKAVVAQCASVRTPGLNEVLGKYEARHGLNRNKEKYHKMWSRGETAFFCKRPIDPDYRDYCIRDVLDLPEVFEKMLSALDGPAERLAFWISNEYCRQGYLALTEPEEDSTSEHKEQQEKAKPKAKEKQNEKGKDKKQK